MGGLWERTMFCQIDEKHLSVDTDWRDLLLLPADHWKATASIHRRDLEYRDYHIRRSLIATSSGPKPGIPRASLRIVLPLPSAVAIAPCWMVSTVYPVVWKCGSTDLRELLFEPVNETRQDLSSVANLLRIFAHYPDQ